MLQDLHEKLNAKLTRSKNNFGRKKDKVARFMYINQFSRLTDGQVIDTVLNQNAVHLKVALERMLKECRQSEEEETYDLNGNSERLDCISEVLMCYLVIIGWLNTESKENRDRLKLLLRGLTPSTVHVNTRHALIQSAFDFLAEITTTLPSAQTCYVTTQILVALHKVLLRLRFSESEIPVHLVGETARRFFTTEWIDKPQIQVRE